MSRLPWPLTCLFVQLDASYYIFVTTEPFQTQKMTWIQLPKNRKRASIFMMLMLRYVFLLINGLVVLTSLQFLLGTIEKVPNLYLDELQEMLVISCWHTVLKSTIWHILHKTGFTMKKVKSLSFLVILVLTYARLPILLPNVLWRNVWTTLQGLQNINQNNSSLLMRALLITAQCTIVETHVSLALYPHIPHHPIIIPLPSSLCRPSWSIRYLICVSTYLESSIRRLDCLENFVLSLSFVLVI